MRARETLNLKRCGRCGQLTHVDEMITSPLAGGWYHHPIRICLRCIEELNEQGARRREKLRSERRLALVPRPRASGRVHT